MVVALLAACYSYLFSAFLFPAVGLTLLLLVYGQFATLRLEAAKTVPVHPSSFIIRPFLTGLLALTLATLLFLPLAFNAWAVNGSEGTPGVAFGDFAPQLWHLLRIFTLWRIDWAIWPVNLGLSLLALLFLCGLVLRANQQWLDQGWLLLWIGTPLLIGNLLLSRDGSIFAEDRYLLFVTPFVLWAIARGIVMLSDRWPPLGLSSGLITVLLLLSALPPLWSPTLARENWRAAANYIATYQQASPGLPAAGVAHVDYTRLPLVWYLHEQLTEKELPVFGLFGGTLTPEQVESVVAPPLLGIGKTGAATLWLTQSHLAGVDDQRVVEGWLNQNFPLISEQFPNGIKLSGYALQSRFAQLPPLVIGASQPQQALIPGLELAACELLTPQLAAQDTAMHPPSGWVHVRLWWRATAPLSDDYLASAQMVGPAGVWGDRLFRDNEALRRWPTSTWPLGEYVRDEIDINLNPVTPAGRYPVLIGLLNGQGQPVGERAGCGEVTIYD